MPNHLPSYLVQMSESAADIRLTVSRSRTIVDAARAAMAEVDRSLARPRREAVQPVPGLRRLSANPVSVTTALPMRLAIAP